MYFVCLEVLVILFIPSGTHSPVYVSRDEDPTNLLIIRFSTSYNNQESFYS